MADFAPDSVSYALTMIALSVAVWTGIELFLFDGSVPTAVASGFACGLAVVFVFRYQYRSDDL